MADNNRYRSTRPGDSYRRAPEPAPPSERMGGSDPLAELARLIGKRDPYAEFGLSSSPREQQEGYSTRSSAHDDWRDAPSPELYANRYEEPSPESHGAHAPESYAAGGESYASEPEFPTARDLENWRSHHAYREPRFEDEAPSYANAASADEGEPVQQDDNYIDDESAIDPNAEQMYDDPPRARRRGGLATALALVGCAVLGTAGAYAYRSYYGQPASTQPPPVITADNSTPTKFVPAPAGDGQAGKVIQDRLANAGREQIVSKQEEPVALKEVGTQAAPRVVLPAPVAPVPAAAQQAPAGSGTPASSEPKKVRTVTIRPDGGDASAKPGNTSPTAARAAGGPLSLDPQAKEPGSAPTARTRSATAPAPRLGAEPGSGAPDGFLVQLSSQKTEAEAASSFHSLQAKFPNELGRRTPVIQRADLGSKGIFYRTMVGPFASVNEANQFCASYKAAGGHCVVPSN
jgi:SPOR domain